jgi:hypothetical protein
MTRKFITEQQGHLTIKTLEEAVDTSPKNLAGIAREAARHLTACAAHIEKGEIEQSVDMVANGLLEAWRLLQFMGDSREYQDVAYAIHQSLKLPADRAAHKILTNLHGD